MLIRAFRPKRQHRDRDKDGEHHRNCQINAGSEAEPRDHQDQQRRDLGYGLIAFLAYAHTRQQRKTAGNSEHRRCFSRAVAAEREDFCGEDITGG